MCTSAWLLYVSSSSGCQTEYYSCFDRGYIRLSSHAQCTWMISPCTHIFATAETHCSLRIHHPVIATLNDP
ncbi:hypothetical protein PR003_g15521 [Phytophthora rubi]|uniref:Uncharacterized protein n=1 Tax=Phytophthora rubi TaxID=129364 RepID=A0A6A4EWS2_9STRA|nr:hypothetical protein PR003_g15521 [Phytophthora rubi]